MYFLLNVKPKQQNWCCFQRLENYPAVGLKSVSLPPEDLHCIFDTLAGGGKKGKRLCWDLTKLVGSVVELPVLGAVLFTLANDGYVLMSPHGGRRAAPGLAGSLHVHRWVAWAHYDGGGGSAKWEVAHLCHHPWCVNPTHLEVQSHQENCNRLNSL